MGAEGSKGISQSEVEDLKASTKFSGKEIQEWYEKFNQDFPDGVIHEKEFIDMYSRMFPRGDARKFASHVFRSYDVDGNGEIDFQEFMATLSVSSRGSVSEKLHWAFSMYDLNKDGVVSMDEVTEMISAIYRMRGEFDRDKVEDAAQKIFHHMDKNKDGELSEEEFILGAQGCRHIHAPEDCVSQLL